MDVLVPRRRRERTDGSVIPEPNPRPDRSAPLLSSGVETSRRAPQHHVGRILAESLCASADGYTRRLQLLRPERDEDPLVKVSQQHRRTRSPAHKVPGLSHAWIQVLRERQIVLAGIELIQKLKKGQYGVPYRFGMLSRDIWSNVLAA